MKNQELRQVPLNQIHAKDNYRKTFRDATLKELAGSIKQNGVIEPIIVRPDGDGFAIVAGERRFRASQLAGLVSIPAVIREADDVDALKLQIIENVQREGVPFMEEAYGIQKLRDKGTLDTKEIAKLIGKSETYVFFQLKLTAMSEDARRIAENGWVTKGVAWEISKIANDTDQTQAANALARTQKEKQITVSGAKNYIRDNFGDSAGRLRKKRVSKFGEGSTEYGSNWKYHLVRFDDSQFTQFKQIVRGRTETAVLSEAVDAVMRDAEEPVTPAVTATTSQPKPKKEKEMIFVNA
jgi:ParB family chromosome partitioning protein